LSRKKKIDYIRKKISKYTLFSGGGVKEMTEINNAVSNSLLTSQKIIEIDEKLKLYSNKFDDAVKLIDSTSNLVEMGKITPFVIDKKKIDKAQYIANLNSREKHNPNNVLFSDVEYINSLKLYFFELCHELKSLENKVNLTDNVKTDYNTEVDTKIKSLTKKIENLTKNAEEYKKKISSTKKGRQQMDIIFFDISQKIIDDEFVKKEYFIECNKTRINNIEKVNQIIPTDLNIINNFSDMILKKIFSEDILINNDITDDTLKTNSDKLKAIMTRFDAFLISQKGGEIDHDNKINLLFELTLKLQNCNLVLQEIMQHNKNSLDFTEKANVIIETMIGLLNKKITKKYHYVNKIDIDSFLNKTKEIKKINDEKKKKQYTNDFYDILEDAFKKIKLKMDDLDENFCIDISKIKNEEIKKAFVFFNIIMN
jgi:hypothetical protein